MKQETQLEQSPKKEVSGIWVLGLFVLLLVGVMVMHTLRA
jgi:hypothetical protein